jgi:hypothetical protein
MVFLENALSSKLNPFITLARSGSIRGLKGFVNKFNGDAELLDDLVFICFSPRLCSELIVVLKNDHWTAKHHKVRILHFDSIFWLTALYQSERNAFIEQLQRYALSQRVRISFLTGDVHCAAVGVLKTLNKGKKSSALAPTADHRYMLNVVSSTFRCFCVLCHD